MFLSMFLNKLSPYIDLTLQTSLAAESLTSALGSLSKLSKILWIEFDLKNYTIFYDPELFYKLFFSI